MKDLIDDAVEANMIECIDGVAKEEALALADFVKKQSFEIKDLCEYVAIVQPDAILRNSPNAPGVRVGNHVAPPSGPEIWTRLEDIIDDVQKLTVDPWTAHCRYETLHPFTDGNGRSGRAVWLWHMHRIYGDRFMVRSFLHWFYYQSLDKAAPGR